MPPTVSAVRLRSLWSMESATTALLGRPTISSSSTQTTLACRALRLLPTVCDAAAVLRALCAATCTT